MKTYETLKSRHLRQLITRSSESNIQISDITICDAQSFYLLIVSAWPGAPEVREILDYAQEKVEIPCGVYNRLVDIVLKDLC